MISSQVTAESGVSICIRVVTTAIVIPIMP